MRIKTKLCIGIALLLSLGTQAANIFWGGGGTGNNWTNAANWGGSVLPGENQADQALVTVPTTVSTPATINTALTFNNKVDLTIRNANNVLVDGGSAAFESLNVNNGSFVALVIKAYRPRMR